MGGIKDVWAPSEKVDGLTKILMENRGLMDDDKEGFPLKDVVSTCN